MYAAISPRQRSRSDNGGGKNDGLKVGKTGNEKDLNSSKFRLSSLGTLGARVRSYTSSNNTNTQNNVKLSPKAQQADLDVSATPSVQRRSFSGLSSHLNLSKYTNTGERNENEIDKKDRRKSMRIFSSFSNQNPIKKEDPMTFKDGRQSSSVDSSSIENIVDDSVHRYYITCTEASEDDLERYANWRPGKPIDTTILRPEDESHVSSANAYLDAEGMHINKITTTTTKSSLEKESPTYAKTGNKNSKFSVSALRRRWSKSDLLDTSMEQSKNFNHARAATDGSQDLANSISQSSFNLRSFRNVREGSSVSTEALPMTIDRYNQSRSASIYSTEDRVSYPRKSFNSHATPAGMPYSNSSVSLVTAVPSNSLQSTSQLQARHLSSHLSNSTNGSPMTSTPGSPRPGFRRASDGTALASSISVGQFLRGAARSRPDLTCAIDDEPGSPIQPISPTLTGLVGAAGHGRTSSISTGAVSPYRPMTPLGEGARSPGEELALLEADLAKARMNSSSIYLAQLEEQQNVIKRRQQRQIRRRSRQNSSSHTLQESPIINGDYGNGIGLITNNRNVESYFPQLDKFNEMTDQPSPLQRNSSSRSPQTLFERLILLEQEALHEEISGMLYPHNNETTLNRSPSPISR